MKHISIFIVFLCLTGTISAQELQKTAKVKSEVLKDMPADTSQKHWLIQGNASLQFTQASFTNWSSGGQNSIGLVTWVNFKANYTNGKHLWGNTIDLGYGFNILGSGNSTHYSKTNDKIEFTTAYGYELHKNKKWYLTVLANLRTQFTAGYNYPDDSTAVSKFMAPGYLVAGIGITYSPAKWFTAYLSPGSGRFTFVTDKRLADSGAFGVDRSYKDATGFHHGKQIKGEFGPYLRADINKDLSKNINLSSSLELFSDYFNQFGNVDVNWGLLLSMKVNKWIAASIQTQVIYDDDVNIVTDPVKQPQGGPRTQFKELFGIGLTYKFK